MTHEFAYERRIEFAETDASGIVHFANYFRYMEECEHAFFRSLGLSAHSDDEDGMVGWVRVDATCSYRRPLRYPDRITIRLLVSERAEKSLAFEIGFFAAEGGDAPLAGGRMRTVCVARDPSDGSVRATDMPAEVAERVTIAPPEQIEAARAALERKPRSEGGS
ncbi:MAG: thioesterase family protein [Planctomycetota bacterium]|jgi:YbgC/YbaW family acyl-CoA thioester hydrolase|nr:thioesterase family protein [Planctomycetota bacterium]MDP6763260.1 thioesterase family protein [Planctomycetota bacterium]MDP6990046.1 thioesterase family protein [Planctomycetota bacterium]